MSDDQTATGDQVKVQISVNGAQTIFGSELTREDANEAREITKNALKKKSIFLQKNNSVRILKPGSLEQRLMATRVTNQRRFGLVKKNGNADQGQEMRAVTG